jgi:hypothetical protein
LPASGEALGPDEGLVVLGPDEGPEEVAEGLGEALEEVAEGTGDAEALDILLK